MSTLTSSATRTTEQHTQIHGPFFLFSFVSFVSFLFFKDFCFFCFRRRLALSSSRAAWEEENHFGLATFCAGAGAPVEVRKAARHTGPGMITRKNRCHVRRRTPELY